MNCNGVREQLVDVAAGAEASAEVQKHVDSCSGCAQTLNELRSTMALLDEWQAPEVTPYFDTRLQARLREEQQKSATSWLDWFRKPALGLAAALLIAAGVGLFQGGNNPNKTIAAVTTSSANSATSQVVATEGSAVGDLLLLEKNSEMLKDFDALDALDGTMDNAPEIN